MSNTIEKDRVVALGMLRFIVTSVTVISATIGIFSFISKARSFEPTYIYTIPTTMLSGPTHTHEPVLESSIIPTNIEYYYDDGLVISNEHNNSTDQLIITSEFVNTGTISETAELQLSVDGKIIESKITTLRPGEIGSIFTTIPPHISWNVNPQTIVLPLPLASAPGSNSYAY